jgi:beta-galactosidase
MIGKNVPVQVYTDYDEAELFINGKSQGRRTKNHTPNANAGQESTNPNAKGAAAPNLDRYRLRWMHVKYEPGEVKVVAYGKDGKVAMEEVVKTAGKPEKLKMDVWTAGKQLKADGNDLAYITISMTDADGNLCPNANDLLVFNVEGEGTFKCACNGDATSLESFTEPKMKLFNGMLVLTIQSTNKAGKIKVTASTVPTETKNKKEKYSPITGTTSLTTITTKRINN